MKKYTSNTLSVRELLEESDSDDDDKVIPAAVSAATLKSIPQSSLTKHKVDLSSSDSDDDIKLSVNTMLNKENAKIT